MWRSQRKRWFCCQGDIQWHPFYLMIYWNMITERQERYQKSRLNEFTDFQKSVMGWAILNMVSQKETAVAFHVHEVERWWSRKRADCYSRWEEEGTCNTPTLRRCYFRRKCGFDYEMDPTELTFYARTHTSTHLSFFRQEIRWEYEITSRLWWFFSRNWVLIFKCFTFYVNWILCTSVLN